MKKMAMFLTFLILAGCSNKQGEAISAHQKIKRTNVTINSYTDCPTFKASDYKTIPYE